MKKIVCLRDFFLHIAMVFCEIIELPLVVEDLLFGNLIMNYEIIKMGYF